MFNDFFKTFLENELFQRFLTSTIIAILTIVAIKIVAKAFKVAEQKAKDDPNINHTPVVFMRRIVLASIVVLGICGVLWQIKGFEKIATSVLASSGVAVLILGFAAQQAMGNLVSGIFISIFKPFSLGDRIKLREQNIDGLVEDISLRHTVVRTFENTRIIIPNSTMNSAILENVTFSDEKVCIFLDVSISYDADIEKAVSIIKDEIKSHLDYFDNRTDVQRLNNEEDVIVRVVSLGLVSVDLRAFVWARNSVVGGAMCSDLRISIKKRFDKENIGMASTYATQIVGNIAINDKK